MGNFEKWYPSWIVAWRDQHAYVNPHTKETARIAYHQGRKDEREEMGKREPVATHIGNADVHWNLGRNELPPIGTKLYLHPAPKEASDYDREVLGKRVREVWINWATEQPNAKTSWLVPWDNLSEPDKEVDRRIGAVLWGDGFAAGLDAAPKMQDGTFKRRIAILEAENEAHRRAQAAIYRALGTGTTDRDLWPAEITALKDQQKPVNAPAPQQESHTDGEEYLTCDWTAGASDACPYCAGEACNLCGHNPPVPCEHDSLERHHIAHTDHGQDRPACGKEEV